MKKIFLPGLFMLAIAVNTDAQNIYTIGGNGIPGFSGDSSLATGAEIFGPAGIAVDGAGNSYFADYYNRRIRKISSAGTITTIAGNGTAGYGGDNGPAINAELNDPMGVAADVAGNIYVADRSNNRIRKIDASGNITTIAGTGTANYTGDNGQATDATLSGPTGVAVDILGNVYVADRNNNVVRKIDLSGTITTIAGTGAAGFNGDDWPAATLADLYNPMSVAVDLLGNVYIADQNNNRVRKVDTFKKISTILGNGVAGYNPDGASGTSCEVYSPSSVAVDRWGNVYISDELNYLIRKVDVNSNGVVTVAGTHGVRGYNGDTGLAVHALIGDCRALAVDNNGNIYFTDWRNNNVNYITSTVTAVPQVDKGVQEMAIYPNPNNGSFTVSIKSTNTASANVVITNVVGEKIKEISAVTNTPMIVELNVAMGIYFVTATTPNGVLTGKVEVGSH
jgi:streptogramin lyase